MKKGFTLIELLVVIAIIGLLSSIVLVSLGPARKKARDARRQSDIRQITLAMEMCYDDSACGPGAVKYPVHAAGANTWTTIDSDGTPVYLIMPSDPTNSVDQVYKWVAGNEQYYCIYTKLENPTAATWFCGSNKGVAQKEYAGPPTSADCCGLNVTL
jgi:prepilin-type N-terminal cleavage/methylation domain-containing protein